MKIGTAIAIYFVIWWTVLFAILPLGVKTQGEAGDVVRGTPSSAPARPRLLMKVLITTVVAALVYGGLWGLWRAGLGFDDVPFLPRYSAQ